MGMSDIMEYEIISSNQFIHIFSLNIYFTFSVMHKSMEIKKTKISDWYQVMQRGPRGAETMLFHLPGLYRMEAGGKNGRHVADDIFKSCFLREKKSITIRISLNLLSNSDKAIVGSGNGFSLHRRRAITWTNDADPSHIGALLGPGVLLKKTLSFKA